MLTPEGQIELLKAKASRSIAAAGAGHRGVVRDTFLHTAAYRKVVQVHREGGKAGQYVKLDFADLLDLDAWTAG